MPKLGKVGTLLQAAGYGVPQLSAESVPPEQIFTLRALDTWRGVQELGLPPGIEVELRRILLEAHSQETCVAELGEEFARGAQPTQLAPTTETLLTLTDAQQALVDRDTNGPMLIQGVAGSGKTSIAVRRLKRVHDDAEQGAGLHLLLTYNRTLSKACRELFARLCGSSDLHVPVGVQIDTLHAWCKRLLEARGKLLRIAYPAVRQELLDEAVEEVSEGRQSTLFRKPKQFWREEIDKGVVGQCAGDEGGSYQVERTGRGAGLVLAAREVVWAVYQAYRRRLAQRKLVDFDDVLILARARIAAGDDLPKCAQVIVDEAQDLSRLALELVADLAQKTDAQLVVLADAAQSIYQYGFTWKSVGLRVGPHNVFKLERNHRNPREIAVAAQRILRLPEDDAQVVQTHQEAGERPQVLVCQRVADQYAALADEIEAATEAGTRLSQIAVLSTYQRDLKRAFSLLRERELPFRYFKDDNLELDDPSVKLITINSAKGLEFERVFVLRVDGERFPGEQHEDLDVDAAVWDEQRRRLLYVAMTRATRSVTLLTTDSDRSPYLDDLGDEVADWHVVGYEGTSEPTVSPVEEGGLDPTTEAEVQIVECSAPRKQFQQLGEDVEALLHRGVDPSTICVTGAYPRDLARAASALERRDVRDGVQVVERVNAPEAFAYVFVVRADRVRYPGAFVGETGSTEAAASKARASLSAAIRSARRSVTLLTTRQQEAAYLEELAHLGVSRIVGP